MAAAARLDSVSAIAGCDSPARLEPFKTTSAAGLDNGLSLYLVAFGGLLLVAVLLDDLAARVRVPGILMVLMLGLLIENHVNVSGSREITLLSLQQAKQITEAALVLVLFFGGLTTNWQQVRGDDEWPGRDLREEPAGASEALPRRERSCYRLPRRVELAVEDDSDARPHAEECHKSSNA